MKFSRVAPGLEDLTGSAMFSVEKVRFVACSSLRSKPPPRDGDKVPEEFNKAPKAKRSENPKRASSLFKFSITIFWLLFRAFYLLSPRWSRSRRRRWPQGDQLAPPRRRGDSADSPRCAVGFWLSALRPWWWWSFAKIWINIAVLVGHTTPCQAGNDGPSAQIDQDMGSQGPRPGPKHYCVKVYTIQKLLIAFFWNIVSFFG